MIVANNLFGYSLAAGDFNGDGRDDLAIGTPGENLGGGSNAGVVHLLVGQANGLGTDGHASFHQDTPGISGATQAGDSFGSALCAADFNGDGKADLAIGVPGDRFMTTDSAGTVEVLYGTSSGASPNASQIWSQTW